VWAKDFVGPIGAFFAPESGTAFEPRFDPIPCIGLTGMLDDPRDRPVERTCPAPADHR
jgi:hypothetical protein